MHHHIRATTQEHTFTLRKFTFHTPQTLIIQFITHTTHTLANPSYIPYTRFDTFLLQRVVVNPVAVHHCRDRILVR